MKKLQLQLILALKNVPTTKLVVAFSVIVGVACGFAAISIKWLIGFVKHNLTGWIPIENSSVLFIVYPLVGIALTWLFVRYVVKDDISHGVTKVLYSISRKRSKIARHNIFSSMIATSFTIGFGGSVGAEGPIVLMGSAIGSNFGSVFRMDSRVITLLLGAGASGAIAGAFGAPLAGLIFTLEVLMLDLTISAVVPLLLSTVSAVTVTYLFIGKSLTFSELIISPFSVYNIPFYLVLGVFCGLVSIYFTLFSLRIEQLFKKQKNAFVRFVTGVLMLGLLIMLFPSLYGEGYDVIGNLLQQKGDVLFEQTAYYSLRDSKLIILLIPLLIILFKVPAMACTFGAGGVGGIFAPSLFIGGICGYFVALFLNTVFGFSIPVGNFTLVGMAGVLAGVMHAPLTGGFLIAEITGGYQLFIPLMLVSAMSFITVYSNSHYSLYTLRLAESGDLVTHDKNKAAMIFMNLKELIEYDFAEVKNSGKLKDLVVAVKNSSRNVFPVVDDHKIFKGVVFLDDVRELIFDSKLYEIVDVESLLVSSEVVFLDESIDSIFNKFEKSALWNIPVLDGDGRYVGFISKSKILSIYRDRLVHLSEM